MLKLTVLFLEDRRFVFHSMKDKAMSEVQSLVISFELKN